MTFMWIVFFSVVFGFVPFFAITNIHLAIAMFRGDT